MIKDNTFSWKQTIDRLKNNPLFLSPGIIIFIGIILRLRQYFSNRSLWRDEASLAINIVDWSFLELIRPLEDDQGSPLGFLWIEKALITWFGSSEYVLRVFPLVCGIISLFVFWFIASRYLNRWAASFSLIIFATCTLLIDFSSEAKQYSTDVLVGLLILGMLWFLRRQRLGYVSAIGYSLLGAMLVWMSHPAIFFLATTGMLAIYSFYLDREYHKVKLMIPIGVIWVASFLVFYVTTITDLVSNEFLITVWQRGFPPSLSNPFGVVAWLIGAFMSSFEYPVGLSSSGLGSFLYVIGAISLYRRDKVTFLSLLLPILFTVFAAFLSQYPFSQRLILFTVPLWVIPLAEGVEQLRQLLATTQFRLAVPILIIILLFHPLLETGNYFRRPKEREEIRPPIEHMRANWQEGDIVYVYYGAYRPFKYYQPKFGFEDSDYILGIESRYEWVKYLPDLNKLREYDRVWILFSHVHSGNGVNEEMLFVTWLDRIGGIQKDWFPRAGASVYLYEFKR